MKDYKLLVDSALLQDILNYLSKRPYVEVYTLVGRLMEAKEGYEVSPVDGSTELHEEKKDA